MRTRYLKQLRRHAELHGLELRFSSPLACPSQLEIAKIALCELADELEKSGDSYGSTMEMQTGVYVVARKIRTH